MYKLALIGRDIAYTRSPEVHGAIAKAIGADISFKVFDLKGGSPSNALPQLYSEFDGFFVTKPYKTEMKRYVNTALPSINAVRSRDKTAFCTDGVGFIRALDTDFDDWRNEVNAVLVLGAGGAAYAVTSALAELGKKVYLLNRTLKNAVTLARSVAGAELYVNQPAEMVVNCTSLGGSGEDALAALCVLPSFAYAFDLVYVGGETVFLQRCARAGARVVGGLDMLIYQAIEGDRLLLDIDMDVRDVYDKVKKQLCLGAI